MNPHMGCDKLNHMTVHLYKLLAIIKSILLQLFL
jgi:hypothetical protein